MFIAKSCSQSVEERWSGNHCKSILRDLNCFQKFLALKRKLILKIVELNRIKHHKEKFSHSSQNIFDNFMNHLRKV
jgi:hypothetical protein